MLLCLLTNCPLHMTTDVMVAMTVEMTTKTTPEVRVDVACMVLSIVMFSGDITNSY